jgi:hypothetical protein
MHEETVLPLPCKELTEPYQRNETKLQRVLVRAIRENRIGLCANIQRVKKKLGFITDCK